MKNRFNLRATIRELGRRKSRRDMEEKPEEPSKLSEEDLRSFMEDFHGGGLEKLVALRRLADHEGSLH